MSSAQQRSTMRWIAQRQSARWPQPARLLVGTTGVGATILIHVLFVGAILFEGRGHLAAFHREGLGADAVSGETEAISTLIFVEDPGMRAPDEDFAERLASHGKVLQNIQLTIISPEPSIDTASEADENDRDQPAVADDSTGDRQNRARLFGLYIGQIQARVERAWARPRTPIEGESFECSVQVLQDRRGTVMEVTLQRCAGNPRWQLSLVAAIQGASPLPAPPDPAVFAESIQLSFHAIPFGPGVDPQGYERASADLARADTTVSRESFNSAEPPSSGQKSWE